MHIEKRAAVAGEGRIALVERARGHLADRRPGVGAREIHIQVAFAPVAEGEDAAVGRERYVRDVVAERALERSFRAGGEILHVDVGFLVARREVGDLVAVARDVEHLLHHRNAPVALHRNVGHRHGIVVVGDAREPDAALFRDARDRAVHLRCALATRQRECDGRETKRELLAHCCPPRVP